MQNSSQNQISKNRPVPVPHGIAVPPKQDDRWKYGLIVAIAILLLLLLLLLFLGTDTQPMGIESPGSQSTGMEQPGTDQAGQNLIGQSVDTNSETETTAGEGSQIAESVEPTDDTENGNDKDTTPPVSDTESEPTHASAIADLLRRLSTELDENTDSQPEDRKNREPTGGDSLVKGDASVNFFGATGKGSKFVFVFDRSSSMSGRPLESVKRELIKSLEPLKSNHSFNVIAYDSTYEIWKDKLISASKENKADAVRFVERIFSRGGTVPREPLLAAIDLKPEIIFFMTDGEFVLNVDEICGKGRKVIINVVQFSDGVPLAVLQELAKRTGGEFMLIKVRGLSDSL